MVQQSTTNAFERAMVVGDNEMLRSQIGEWFNKSYRTPQNAIDIAPIVQSAIDAAFALKVDECKRNWRNGEAESWNDTRQAFDAAMCAFVETMGAQPNPEDDKWGGSPRPAIGAGWGNQTA